MQQNVLNPKLKWWQGILLIVGIVVLLTAFQYLAAVVALMIGGTNAYTVASLAFWIFGGAVALALVRAFVMSYQYEVQGVEFRIHRLYSGLKPRNAVIVITRSIVDFDTPEAVEGRHPGTHPRVYTRRKCDLPVKALAYLDGGALRVLHIQPNEELTALLNQAKAENTRKR